MTRIFKNFIGLTFIISIFSYPRIIKAQQRPRILEHPADAIAAREEPLTLNCKATGRPPPDISWYHNGTPLVPSERRVILPEGLLFFLRVMHNKREQDAGVYWCEARSSAGIAVSRNATLQIATLKEEFRSIPKDTVALVGGPVILNCTPPRGIPEPSVLWYKDKKLLDLSGKRLSMIDNGSLMISEIQTNDAGRYECSAQNIAGNKTSPVAMLKVLAPPTVVRGPHDTEVIEGDGLDIPCELTGDPQPFVSWHRENGQLPEGRSRTLLDNTLRIEDTRFEDQGRYICKGFNEGGNVSISIMLRVFAIPTFLEAPIDINANEGETIILPCRATGRPPAIIIWDKIETNSLNTQEDDVSRLLEAEAEAREELLTKAKIMSFRNKRNQDAVASQRYELPEEFDDIQSVALDHHEHIETYPVTTPIENLLSTPLIFPELNIDKNGGLVIENFKKTDEGWYACAAINEAGSVVKKFIIHSQSTLDSNIQFQIPDFSNNRWGNDQSIILTAISSVSSQAFDVFWELTKSEFDLTSALNLYYRPIFVNNDTAKILSKHYLTASASIITKKIRLDDLKPHTQYEIFATLPKGLGGHVSNLRRAKTKDGPPSAPPTDVRVGVINNTAAYVRWSPPPFHLLNGELTGYKIQIKSNTTNKLLGQMSLNATTQSVVINSLSPGGRYIARVAPLTSGGLGPYSPPAPLHMDPLFIFRPPKTDPTSNNWGISLMPGIALGVLVICLISGAIFAILWARRNKRNLKASYPASVLTSSLPDKSHTIWLHGNTTIKPTHSIKPVPISSEYAEVTPTIITKHSNNSAPPEPYATVTLQHGIQSDDTCIKCSTSPNSDDFNALLRMPINICDMLPPPPDHPYNSYKPPNNNMTIRTNPAALSPQIRRRVPPTPSRWTTLPPPIPNFPQNWTQTQQKNPQNNEDDTYTENEYESGSVLYEQFRRDNEASYFNEGGEPTEEYYRNVNMEFFEDQDFEPSTPPPPCPDSCNQINPNIKLLANNRKQENIIPNARRLLRNTHQNRSGSCDRNDSNSSDESEAEDNRWVPRGRRSRSRSKSSDRKFQGEQ